MTSTNPGSRKVPSRQADGIALSPTGMQRRPKTRLSWGFQSPLPLGYLTRDQCPPRHDPLPWGSASTARGIAMANGCTPLPLPSLQPSPQSGSTTGSGASAAECAARRGPGRGRPRAALAPVPTCPFFRMLGDLLAGEKFLVGPHWPVGLQPTAGWNPKQGEKKANHGSSWVAIVCKKNWEIPEAFKLHFQSFRPLSKYNSGIFQPYPTLYV